MVRVTVPDPSTRNRCTSPATTRTKLKHETNPRLGPNGSAPYRRFTLGTVGKTRSSCVPVVVQSRARVEPPGGAAALTTGSRHGFPVATPSQPPGRAWPAVPGSTTGMAQPRTHSPPETEQPSLGTGRTTCGNPMKSLRTAARAADENSSAECRALVLVAAAEPMESATATATITAPPQIQSIRRRIAANATPKAART